MIGTNEKNFLNVYIYIHEALIRISSLLEL